MLVLNTVILYTTMSAQLWNTQVRCRETHWQQNATIQIAPPARLAVKLV